MTDLPTLALSVRQPWAWAIMHAGKNIENRGPQAIRRGNMKPGRIALHASAGLGKGEYELAVAWIESRRLNITVPPAIELVRGGIIGSVKVAYIVTSSPSRWWTGPRGLVLEDPEPCEPIACTGALGYFDWRSMPTSAGLREPAKWMVKAADAPITDETETPMLF